MSGQGTVPDCGKPVTTTTLLKMKRAGDPVACLTAYDAGFTRVLESAGIDVVLVGDSLGMVVQGHETTLPVRIEDMVYHGANVARARKRALQVVDLPFMSYSTPDQALGNAARLMRDGGAQVVKLEGGQSFLDTVRFLGERGIPVCGHLGLLPQSVHKLGGYRVQGRDAADAARIMEDAVGLEQAGAAMLVLECVPSGLAREISRKSGIPVIGIGAGADCDGQVLVLYDMLGINPKPPKFSRNFLAQEQDIHAAIVSYINAVKTRKFPAAEHGFL